MEPHESIRAEAVPRFIGPYRVVRALAEGGMAAVFAVQDPEGGRLYAAKVLRVSRHGALRFGREYRALTRLDHPDVVRVYRYGVTDAGEPYLLMELLEGVPAQVHVKAVGRPGDPARTTEALRVLARVANALVYLHGHGIVHRDLKSTNVLVLPDGRVKVLDFGTARLVHASESITDPGEFVGTFQYASPEQLTGASVDARADLYALGVLAYRLLSGRRPFEGISPEVLARAHLREAPLPVDQVVPGLPPDISPLVDWLLAKRPEDRPASARVVLERLAPHLAATLEPGPARRGFLRREHIAAIEAFVGGDPSVLVFVGPAASGRDRLVERTVEEAQRRGIRTVLLEAGAPAVVPSGEEPLLVAIRSEVAGTLDLDPFLRATRPLWLVVAWSEDAAIPVADRVQRVPVGPLSVPEVAALAAERLGVDAVPPELARRLHTATGGLVRLLEAVVDALPPGADAGTPLPDLLDGDLGLPLEAVGEAGLRVMEAVALAEGDLDLLSIAWAVDATEEDTRRALDKLVRAHILEPAGGGWVFRLGLAADRVRARTRVTRRSLLCRRLAERLLAPTPRTVGILLHAGRVDEAAQALVHWSDDLLRQGRLGEAVPMLERVAARGPAPALFPFWHRYAHALAEARPDTVAADHAVSRAQVGARTPVDHAATDEVAATLARARNATDAEHRALLRAIGRYDQARRPDLAASARTRLAELLTLRGELESAHALAARATEDAVGADAIRAWIGLSVVRVERGEWPAAEAAARNALRVSGEDPAWRAHGTLARILRLQGRFSEARRTIGQVLPAARAQASGFALASLLLGAAELATELGRFGEARERLAEARALIPGEIPARVDAPFVLLKARLMERAGDPGTLLLVEGALARARSRGYRTHGARLQAFRGRLLAACGMVAEGAAEVAAARDVSCGALFGTLALALERPDPGTAEDPDRLYEGLEDWLEEPWARVPRLDRAAVRVRFHAAAGRTDAAAEARVAAMAAFADVLSLQDPEDRDALRVHPGWRSFAG